MLDTRMKEHEIEEWRLEEEEKRKQCQEEGRDFVRSDDHASLALRVANACNGIAFELENQARRMWDALEEEEKIRWAIPILNGASYATVAENFLRAHENDPQEPPRRPAT